METEGSLPNSIQPATCPYPEPDPSSPCPPSYFSNIHFNIILPSTPGCFKVVSFPQVSPLKPCMHLYSPHTCYMPCPSVFLTWSPKWYLVRSTEHTASRYAVFSTPLLPRPSWAQISSSAPYSRKPSAYIPPSIWPSFTPIQNNRQDYSFVLMQEPEEHVYAPLPAIT